MLNTLNLISIIYLWTRDAGMPVSKETEDYIIDHIRKLSKTKTANFSDKTRADMAMRIYNRYVEKES